MREFAPDTLRNHLGNWRWNNPRDNNYLTTLGRRVLVTALVIREYFVQPTLVRNAL